MEADAGHTHGDGRMVNDAVQRRRGVERQTAAFEDSGNVPLAAGAVGIDTAAGVAGIVDIAAAAAAVVVAAADGGLVDIAAVAVLVPFSVVAP